MADNAIDIELPRFAREIAVISPAKGGHPTTVRPGILRSFSGIFDTTIEQGRPSVPNLSHLALDALVAAALSRENERSTTRLPRNADSTDAVSQQIYKDTNEEPTVRDILSGEQDGGPEKSGLENGGFTNDPKPNQTLADALPRLEHLGDRTTDDGDQLGRFDIGTDHGLAGRTDSATTDSTDSYATVDLTTVEKRTEVASDHSVGEPSPFRGTDSDGPVVRDAFETDTNPHEHSPRLVMSQSETDYVGRKTQKGRHPSSLDSSRTPQSHTNPNRIRMTVRDDGSRTDDGAQVANATGESRPEVKNGSAPSDTPVQRADSESNETLSRLLPTTIKPESRLVDRLYSALREREAIEQRRRGGL